MAWRGGDFSKDDIAFDLSRKHVAALEDVLLRVRDASLALGQIRAEDCRHPALERNARPVVSEIHIYENIGGRSGIDPQPGRLPAVAKYRAPDGEVRRRAASA
jgi:hypothetical protein